MHDPESKESGTERNVRLILDCYFKEAEILQSEMDKRLERHAQSFYFLVTLLAAVIVAVVTAIDKDFSGNSILLALVYLPWLTTPIAGLFFDDELLRAITDCYVGLRLGPKVRELLENAGPQAKNVFNYSFASRFGFVQKELGISSPRIAAKVRPLLFFVPEFAALLALSFLSRRLYMGTLIIRGVVPTWRWAIILLGWASDLWLFWLLFRMQRSSARLWERIEEDRLPSLAPRNAHVGQSVSKPHAQKGRSGA